MLFFFFLHVFTVVLQSHKAQSHSKGSNSLYQCVHSLKRLNSLKAEAPWKFSSGNERVIIPHLNNS